MNMQNALMNMNFKRPPYRGIFGEVGKELGISRVSVREKWRNQNPEVVKRVLVLARKRLDRYIKLQMAVEAERKRVSARLEQVDIV